MKDSRSMRAYNEQVIQQRMAAALADAPRGTKSRLAREAGVSYANVSKWASGTICPLPERWPIIEDVLGMEPGELTRISGVDARAAVVLQMVGLLDELTDAIAPIIALDRDHPLSKQEREGLRRRVEALKALSDQARSVLS